jgi:tRNA pseudouridine55 synthase
MTTPPSRRDGATLSGILNVDKPSGWTSHAAVVAARRWSRQRRIGHAGTLDPLATGVLLLCLGQATRVSQYLMASSKRYRATVRLGVSTTTHDAEGEVLSRCAVSVTRGEVDAALASFVGPIDQVPPAYSAIKRGGKRLYEYARRGEPVRVSPRKVVIHQVALLEWTPPDVLLDVHCGPGTYVRALARDLGQVLGCGAMLAALRRTQSGQFTADQATPLADLEHAFADMAQVEALLHPLDDAFAHLQALRLDARAARQLAMGQAVSAVPAAAPAVDAGRGEGLRVTPDGHSRAYEDAAAETYARAYGPGGQFLALVSWDEEASVWRPRRVFVQPDEIREDGR